MDKAEAVVDKRLFLECIGGISGDMCLGAFLDLGVEEGAFLEQLKTLPLGGWSLRRETQHRHHLQGTRVVVEAEEEGIHRHLSDIEALVEASGLSSKAKALSLEVFRRLAEAEGKVHGMAPEEVHFHEVGAVDALIDICGFVIAWESLGFPRIHCTPPPMGRGSIGAAHGVLPIPAPAVVDLLKGKPVRYEGEGERTTPTGAALLAVFAEFEPLPESAVLRTGYGLGQRDTADMPNLLRASLVEVQARQAALCQMETNIDDASPEMLSALADKLRMEGALDVWQIPCVMKKGRLGVCLGLLCEVERVAAISTFLFRESTALGLRLWRVERRVLSRTSVQVQTEYGPIRVKQSFLEGKFIQAKPEFDDCLVAAQKGDIPLAVVMVAAIKACGPRE
ncbi:MAG: nickel pincer cofactor biosynthesis protein LarC [Proteobacteria bacterium]|nr:nickel pincer cofactor biosynthesis protein LarC [Cystobacterineae bacterium]MCL2314275.1 nickel pincer cofactor biosynthesis protein LarC [Pseudomonadota bacterium]